MEILHVRSLLECEAAREAAVSEKNIRMLTEMSDRVCAVLAGPRPSQADHNALDRQPHLTIIKMAGSRLLGELIEGLKINARM